MPKGYMMAEIEVHDPADYETYRLKAPATIAAYGGRYLVRGGDPQLVEGSTAPGRVVILEFDSPEQAERWYNSPEYQAILPTRLRATKGRALRLVGFDG